MQKAENQSTVITVDKKKGICHILLNRPRCLNAVNDELRTRLYEALKEIAVDRETKVLIIEGAGEHFSSGADVNLFNQEVSLWRIRMKEVSKIIILMREMPQIIICKVRGVAYGVAANLALACDFVVASETMRFCEVFSNIGLIPDGGGHYFLPRIVGLAKAMELALLGEEIDGLTAASKGLIYKCVPDSDLDKEADQLASKLANKSSQAMVLIKEGLVGSYDMTLNEVMEWEAAHQTIMLQTEEHKASLRTLLRVK